MASDNISYAVVEPLLLLHQKHVNPSDDEFTLPCRLSFAMKKLAHVP
ncbi:hypothetical protein, unlikely [Trypanosoma brucei gambiense DAL972]|uniref:Uncharacterized protein n=3 Tax=Trypanosoma brucei TaxID=5691 RepID=Q4GYL3_TRYB2|nr:hypothetical protein, unlikely [Trypanosoma brucei brucei TREU927]XP_011771505.1 hypothetical protein, unlikely [Trypanosoma brucei gambiense DAL972]RHW74338.1 hypothetical protein DPX39_010036200 [Trypanosoma brucei equiperdum]CAJ16571.1 hypothetical protein, unlikely [Trypanosoma brucei brucei TREU927]CBH09064.1 hypothetical protein, unlikely [Trypanosoma brucei gambiense DAL972]|eukprot:XP_011771505.1 hypothetical protein, unlikely [Trypanosoma brucei gambiense DAL972]